MASTDTLMKAITPFPKCHASILNGRCIMVPKKTVSISKILSYPLIPQLGFHLSPIISFAWFIIWDMRQPIVEIVIVIVVILVSHFGSLQALRPRK